MDNRQNSCIISPTADLKQLRAECIGGQPACFAASRNTTRGTMLLRDGREEVVSRPNQ